MNDIVTRVRSNLDRLAGDLPALGLAISGGGDSTALLHIVADWAQGRKVMTATVDHALRPESAAEAAAAGRVARSLGLPHVTLVWQRGTEIGNLMAAARDARLRLLSGWAQHYKLPVVALGHTRDDIAETLMMRMARGAGVDGLAGMAEWRDAFGVRWLRPMLNVGRDELRIWMQEQGISWIDDPSNDNIDYDRIRIRKAMSEMNIDTAALAMVAQNLTEARDALAHYAAETCHNAVAQRGNLLLPRAPLRRAPAEIQRRVVGAACRWITNNDYPPRRAAVSHALAALSSNTRVVLDGVLFDPDGDRIKVMREPAAAMRALHSTGPEWDQRWIVTGVAAGQTIAALGLEEMVKWPWRNAGLHRDETAASPAIWQNGTCIAAPLIQPTAGLTLRSKRTIEQFKALILKQ